MWSTEATNDTYSNGTPYATTRMGVNLVTAPQMKKQMHELQKRTHMLKLSLTVRLLPSLDVTAADPFSLSDLLIPLVSAASLPEHPSMSIAYTSPVLTNMAQHACEMVQRERKTLANAKRLMTKLRGDETWIPCGLLCSPKDEIMFDTSNIYKNVVSCKPPHRAKRYTERTLLRDEATSKGLPDSCQSSSSKTEVESANKLAKEAKEESNGEGNLGLAKTVNNEGSSVESVINEKQAVATATHNQQDYDVLTKDQQHNHQYRNSRTTDLSHGGEASNEMTGAPKLTRTQQDDLMEDVQQDFVATIRDVNNPTNLHSPHSNRNGNVVPANFAASEEPSKVYLPSPDAEQPEMSEPEEGNESQVHPQAAPRRMRTRAQAQAASEPTMSSRNESPESSIPPEIHPLFMIPESAIPDKNLGLPPNEAEETRRLLNTYVQKQEEITRGAEKFYDSLLRADRKRKQVLKWCKAEAHVGEMSDGEDWYDKEEWGLDSDLKKGQNEDDEDTNAVQGKKTRGRRA